MSYIIEYTPELARSYPQTHRCRTVKPGKMIFLILFITAAIWVRLQGIPDFLIPGDVEITKVAASDFMDHVKSGMQIGEAATVFCKQIIDGAGV